MTGDGTTRALLIAISLSIGCGAPLRSYIDVDTGSADAGNARPFLDAGASDTEADAGILDAGATDTEADAGFLDAGAAPFDAGSVEPPPVQTAAGDRAELSAHTLPTSLACAQSVSASVTMRNVGDTTWTSADHYALGAVNPEDLFLTAGGVVELAHDVAPGATYTFSLGLSAPGPGDYLTQWRMVHGGVADFGDIAAATVSVPCVDGFQAYPAIIDGTFGMPLHEQRIASRNTALLRTGHVVTGDDNVDNAVLGGGSPDGGIWLSGRFHFEIDANGQNTAASFITVFSDEHFAVNGGMFANGELHMGSPAGVDISGLFKNGVVTGYVAEAGNTVTRDDALWLQLSAADQNYLRGVWHGADLSFVHGLMQGTGTH